MAPGPLSYGWKSFFRRENRNMHLHMVTSGADNETQLRVSAAPWGKRSLRRLSTRMGGRRALPLFSLQFRPTETIYV